ncbi:lytic transglycosylase domain-containing protein [Rickettsia prowazekii]|uniref:Soluble lytic murein transglycosylase n=2 Tax=Rickettsia prowazekii TaxID=782 RepID=D5AWY7_RICPP|nr:lytic transglycosylase domain-containing protein [Rickettsia prowazekii]EOB09766.1 Soluble lytic murein transglycosylase [Rickettsia prowazekii str. GvF12]ADE29926.1 Soluble lytic murein transglycosylase precursor [Rickettsia prowazekii str. Rp22]AFE49213.1 soluble lytic murein transglycosylase precursor (slt) [Rickettsia prowazekii str. Chernikova]AFE50059.1 soluble lytic murein transglycosylase precursor (slt) [Rickettsia prowazekii str. Katsinyian]AFE50904.1 soluble lytic murein transgly
MKIKLFIAIFLLLALKINANSDSIDNVQQVFTYIDQKKWSQAKDLALAINIKVLTKIVLSQAFLDNKCSDNSFQEIIKFLQKNPDWPQNKLIAKRAEEYLNNHTNKKVIFDWFSTHPPLTGKGYKFYAVAAISLVKDYKILLPIIKKAWVYGNFTPEEENIYYNKWSKYLTVNDHLERIEEHLWLNDIKTAKRSLKYVDQGYRNSFKAQIAIISTAPNAEKLFKNVPEKYYTSGLLYRYLDFKKMQKPTKEMIALFKKAKNNRKHFAKWCRLQSYYARAFIDYKDFANSYRMATMRFPACHKTIREQEWLAGWLSLSFLKKPDQALMHFNKFIKVVKTPISLARGFYWLGRTYEAKGDKQTARKFYEQASRYSFTFYGQVANIELNRTKLVLPNIPVITSEVRKTIENKEIIKAIRLFVKYNKNHLAMIYSKEAIKNTRNQAEIQIIANIIKECNNTHYMVDVAKIAAQKHAFIPDCAFPTPYNLTGLPISSSLTYGIIRQESVFDHKAISCSNAMGLMQLIKGTACDIAKSINMKCDVGQLIKNPSYNIKLGSHHFKKLLDDHKGSYVLSIASYNAGSNNVMKWIEKFGDPRDIKDTRKIIDWIELIPYKETRNYVQRVLENVQIYRVILNKNSNLYFKRDLHACTIVRN